MSLTLPVVTIEGTLTGDPELRFTQGGKAVANLNIACNTRRKNPNTDQWEDGDTTFQRGTIWGDMAENVAESLTKGTRVLAHGYLKQQDWEDKEGNKRTSFVLDIQAIGPSLKWATARVTRVSKNDNGGGGGGRQNNGGGNRGGNNSGGGNWGNNDGGSWGGNGGGNNGWGDDEPPF